METKSRYEVIADLEERKRQLISEKNSLKEVLFDKERNLKQHERKVEDIMRTLEREKEDIDNDIAEYKFTLKDKENNLQELIDNKTISEGLYDQYLLSIFIDILIFKDI